MIEAQETLNGFVSGISSLTGSTKSNNALSGKVDSGIVVMDETDPTVPQHVKTIKEEDIANWNEKATISDMEKYIEENKDSLKGEKGEKGDTGESGINGVDGVSCTHSWNGTTLSITSANGTTSANLKGEKGDAGKDGVNGKDGTNGKDGQDGYTPIKGKDYFDGKDGTNGKDGIDGKTPVKGVDYYTEADKQEIVNLVLNELPSSEGVSY